MDGSRFDSLTRTLTTAGSRRRALAGLLTGVFGVLEWQGQDDASAHDLKAKCKKKSGAAKKKCLKKAKKHAAAHVNGVPPPPPPPPTRCPQPAAPYWCASANTCVPACPSGRVFDPTSCSCACVERTCCSCHGGSNPFCSAAYATESACMAACDALNPNWTRLRTGVAEGQAWVCDASVADGCRVTCVPDTCGSSDYCANGSPTCGDGGFCLRPLGGGPSRCGAQPPPFTRCGCASHADCADQGAGAFCAQDTGGFCGSAACDPPGATTFCAVPR